MQNHTDIKRQRVDYKAMLHEFDVIAEKRNKQIKKVKRKRNKGKKIEESLSKGSLPYSLYATQVPQQTEKSRVNKQQLKYLDK